MKKYFVLFVALVSFAGYSQISFGARHRGKPADLKKETLERFKSTTTIFVLSDVFNTSEYEQILQDTWTITPYKIMKREEFNILDLYKENLSFATLSGFKLVKEKGGIPVSTLLHTYFDIAMYNIEEINLKLEKLSPKLSPKKRTKKLKSIFQGNKKAIVKFYLYPTTEFLETALDEKNEAIVKSLYSEDVFYNYTKGMLKNYFQKTNALLTHGKTYWMYKKDFDAEKLASLATSMLFVPEYVTQKKTGDIVDRNEKEIKKLFGKYSYGYEFISSEDLDKAIAKNEEFYYLRYVRVNAERFVQVVNSKSGEVIFRDYITGLGYNLKPKNLEYLNDTITKSKKNLAK